MRLRDKNKLAHEKAVADELLESLKIKPTDFCHGNPDKKEPDRLYRIDKKIVGIEVVTAYYTEQEAKMTAEIAAEKPLAPDEIRIGEVIGGPDDAICESIQHTLNEKCAKKYSGTDETWLCINADAALTEMVVIEECVKDLEVPENPFTRIFVTVHKLEPEGGGLGLIEISPKTVPVEDEIRLRAYSLYVQRGRRNGFALDDWLEAEAEILRMLRQRAETPKPRY